MARRKKETALTQPATESANGHAAEEGNSYADTLREQIGELEARRQQMEAVQDLIRSTMRKPGVDSDSKLAAIVSGLYEMGISDQDVAYIMEQKEGRDGNHYMGYTFTEVNSVRSSLKAKQVQLAHLEGRGTHQAALEQGNDTLPGGPGF